MNQNAVDVVSGKKCQFPYFFLLQLFSYNYYYLYVPVLNNIPESTERFLHMLHFDKQSGDTARVMDYRLHLFVFSAKHKIVKFISMTLFTKENATMTICKYVNMHNFVNFWKTKGK